MVQSLKSNHDTLAEIARDKKHLKISSHIHHTQNPSAAAQVLKQQNKWKRIEFVQQPKVADTDYNVGCEYANPLVALFEDKDQQDSINELDSDFDGYRFNVPELLNPFFDRQHLQKKTKISHYTAEIVVEILDKHGKIVPICALMETGASSSIVLSEFVKKGRAGGYKGHPTK